MLASIVDVATKRKHHHDCAQRFQITMALSGKGSNKAFNNNNNLNGKYLQMKSRDL